MKCKIEINMDNDSFFGCPNLELYKILDTITQQIGISSRWKETKKLFDSDGNSVGNYSVEEEK